ncbi:Biopolymer transport protein ExbD [Stieleria neptunia]|uniref:Biopolymer transport protein ExbD n=1 Tax=Stieleria neptunia TaxID=2527979 RepID=A0A518HZ47_9BACT|nr:biopolymer transporter ExbD [Stieleria neptunia]QDV46131.1 Biopolymer transport protein ExbD [Stieleria neptunia]
MKIPNQQNRPFTGANMTPMIDVVFLLIIFFLVSSHLARQESRLPVELPVASTHNPLSIDPVSVTITVNRDRQILVGGKILDEAGLDAILNDVVRRDGESASLRIRTDGAVPYGNIEPILKASSELGLLDIKLAVKEQG